MTFIKKTVYSLGVPATRIGFHQLCRCVSISVENEKRMTHLQKGIYVIVAAEFNTNRKAVARNLRTYADYLWNRGNRERLNELAGYKVLERPAAGELISILTTYALRTHCDCDSE